MVRILGDSPLWDSVVTVSRSRLSQEYATDAVKQIIIDLDTLKFNQEVGSALQNTECVFCCLGTTRAAAGTASGFRKVDYDYVRDIAQVAKEVGVPQFCLVSSQGANASLPASDLKLFHGLLYAKTKGMAERTVIDQGFHHTTIMRPGLLDRKELARSGEKWGKRLFLPCVSTAQVAQCMVQQVEENMQGSSTDATHGTAVPVVHTWNMKDIQRGSL